MTEPDPLAMKAALRAATLARRDALEIDDRLEWDAAIAEHLTAMPELATPRGPVSAFWPIRSEADPRPVLEWLRDRGIPTCLPVTRRDAPLLFRAWAPWEPIVPGGFGTLIPPESAPLLRPALLIVPLAAFDRACHRIGYGKGHYDRTLAALAHDGGPAPIAIGIAYGAQQVDIVPATATDIRLHAVVTEHGVLRP